MSTASPAFEKTGRGKEDFMSELVRTLQSPVAELQHAVDKIESEPEQACSLAAKARTSLAQIRAVIEDMQALTATAPQSFMDELSIIDLLAATRECLEACRNRSDSHGICMERCRITKPALAFFDPDLYRLVLSKLCLCALENSGCETLPVRLDVADGWASVRVGGTAKPGPQALAEPADGDGSSRSRQQGTHRGLPEIRRLIERYGGKLEQQGRPGPETFILGLPLYGQNE